MKGVIRAAYFAFILSVPIETIDFFGNQSESRIVSISRLLGLLLLLLALLDWRRCFRRIPAEFWLVGWFIAAYSASQAWIPAALDWNFFRTQMILVYGVAVYLISTNLFQDADFRGAALYLYGWWTGLVAAAMMTGLIAAAASTRMGDRASIMGQNPNTAASLFAAGALCIVGNTRLFAPKRLGIRLPLALGAVAVLIMAILQTGSRGGLLALIGGVLGLVLCGGKSTRKQRVFIASVVFAALAAFIVREFQLGTSTSVRLRESVTEGDTAGRDKIFAAAWEMVEERPLLGFGGANNEFLLGLRLGYSNHGVYSREAHNLALELLTEVGAIGAFPFFAALFYALWRGWRHARRTGDALPFALMCAQLTINMSGVETNQPLFWIVFAAASAVT